MDLNISSTLLAFIDDNPHVDLNDCVDFICDVFDVSATDELIEEVADLFFS